MSLLEDPRAKRSEKSTGSDMLLDSNKDLKTDPYGDLVLTSGSESISKGLLRRISTPSNGYGRWVEVPKGLVYLDEGYGNETYSYLSSPLSNTSISKIKDAIIKSASKDPRISLESVEAHTSSNNSIEIELSYTILSESKLVSLRTTLGGLNV